MRKSLSSAKKLHQFARFINSPSRPVSKSRSSSSAESARWRPESHQVRLTTRTMEAAESSEGLRRTPLAEVVADCVQRWFQDTLKEARNGDTGMQVLVGQMYHSGYGVARDVQRGKAWISRAAKSRSSVWKVGDKHPGYNASDSDSDDAKEAAK
ncbi:Unknown protein [Striga hermonthica]|uniref:Uncharacterized protein n=1 Tax=Striga hermonthica TaxID=68872 RepID=A0A9N7NHB3_STRHE|nr:Unknown protein [Striga hermonthica]